jgi:hypothetical protein
MEEFRIKENELRSISLVQIVSANTGLTMDEAAEVVAYNIITIYQLAKIANRSISAIQNKLRPLNNSGKPELKVILPFKYKDNKGPVFILFDQACYDYIISTHKPNAISHEEVHSKNRKP